MIAFETLLLGLIIGSAPVRVMAGPEVKTVEVRLDGVRVGTMVGEPWTLSCDFGPAPHPHELVAIGRDRSGAEVGRAHQWVNMPRQPIEVRMLLERAAGGDRVVAARLSWETVKALDPERVRVTLDGRAFTVADPRRFEIPAYDPKQIHVLSAELFFPGDKRVSVDVAFGGDLGEQTQTELTAVPVVLEPGAALPGVAGMADWFRIGGGPARTAAVEEGPADVVFVVDMGFPALMRKVQRRDRERSVGALSHLNSRVFWPLADPDDDRMVFLFATPQYLLGRNRETRDLFPAEPAYRFTTHFLYSGLGRLELPNGIAPEQMLGDAVAVAGTLAAAGNRRRAVVLLLADGASDRSAISPAAARAYLTDLHVPLRVWSFSPEVGHASAGPWGQAEDTNSERRFDRAVKRLRETLEAQRIVWLDGAHLPQRAHLTERARGIRIAE